MRRVLSVSAMLVLAPIIACGTACGTSSEVGSNARLGANEAAIQGGTDDTSHTYAVGVCYGVPGNCEGLCSGTLIAPNLVLTARHCVADSPEQIDCTQTQFAAAHLARDMAITTNSSTRSASGNWYSVKQIKTPTAAKFCGNDIALLILNENVPSTVAQPAVPSVQYSIGDHKRYSSQMTAIGYGVTAADPASRNTSGKRRILQDIQINCIPNAPDMDCYKDDPGVRDYIAEAEFAAGGGTCRGDSGSGAFEQLSFDQGKAVVLGVLSRGGFENTQCLSSLYTRVDSWRDLVVSTAKTAAQLGGYPVPDWTADPIVPPEKDAGAKDSGGKPAPAGMGEPCEKDEQCESNKCSSLDGDNYVCTQECASEGTCPDGFVCTENLCAKPNANSGEVDPGEPANETAADQPAGSTTTSGCAVVQRKDPSKPVPWKWAILASAVALVVRTVRKRRT